MEGRNFWCSLVVLVVVLASSGSVLEKAAAQETSSVEEGATLDVLYLSEACLGLEEECEQTRPDHFIEYFGADWCEPCKVLDNDIDVINTTDVFVMRHHPSPLDISYNTDSNLRFNWMYRLLFLPSLIHNGEGLLTGTSQAQDLGNVMSNSTTTFAGLNEVALNNSLISWNSSVNGTVSVWRLGDVQHETEDYIHRNMVIGAAHFNASSLQGNISQILEMNGTGLVVMLETDGERNLTVKSANPAAGLDLIDNEDGGITSTIKQTSGARLAMATMVGLLVLLAPALVMWKNALKSAPMASSEQE
ncbi:MAG: hypothetical protein OSA38_05235 [Candidatus Poseidoniaceae archaeon]|nr:hypothetical protein [Candidatus Poseidoniaceae archaeon]